MVGCNEIWKGGSVPLFTKSGFGVESTRNLPTLLFLFFTFFGCYALGGGVCALPATLLSADVVVGGASLLFLLK